ncbi:MAG: hypothetical protein IJ763_01465 [Lachnospiraceae bacterium]|nr:hypothetical protein [Lachnospiraceae bacterium]
MNLEITMVIGLIGAFLMFCGDMTLYYSKNDYKHDGTLNPIIDIMKKVSIKRLYIGGMIGPLTAFLYCVGYYHLVLFTKEEYITFGWVLFIINCLGIICGGAYHSHCANLGLIGRHDKESLKEVENYLNFQKIVAFGIQAVGFIGMAFMIVMGWTILPRWMIILSPLVLVLFLPLVRKLPKGLHMIICGGWTNLISVIYYVAALICVKVL